MDTATRSNAKAALETAQHEMKVAEATCQPAVIETARRNYVQASQAWESRRNSTLTLENIKEYCSNVMDSRQVRDYNAWAGTKYRTAGELIDKETARKLLKFYS